MNNIGWLYDVSNPAYGGKHTPVQSHLYTNNKENIKGVQEMLYAMIIVLFASIVLIGSWVNLEEGKFPFNINFIADIAYAKNKTGTPIIALLMVFIMGMILYFGRLALLQVAEKGVVDTVKTHLNESGQLRLVRPISPSSGDTTTHSAQ